MKKYLFLFCTLSLLFFTQLVAQVTPILEKDRAYSMERFSNADSLMGNYQSDRVLKILPPMWATQLDTIYNDSFPKANRQMEHSRDSAMEWVWVEGVFLNCTQRDCERKNILYFQTIITEPLKQQVNFRAQDSVRIVKVQKLIRHGKLEWVEDEFPEVKFEDDVAFKLITNKLGVPFYVKVKGGIWTEWEEQICRYEPRRSSKFTISQIQQALQERGYYDGPIDNILNKELRAAMVKFKQDENLAVCGDDIGRLLKALGIEY